MVDMKKKKELEELQEDFNSLTRKRYQAILDVDKITKELVELAQKIYETSPDYVKVVCLNCGGRGYNETDDGKKVKCKVCDGKLFMWVKRFKEVEDDVKSS
jgi:DNA-directed RNA polymerase subunit RPC12/RpoP